MTCPVMNDLIRHLAEEERREAREEAIGRRADEIVESGDLDAMLEQLTALEANRFHKSIEVICQANTPQSREQACMEIRHLLLKAANLLAEKQIHEEEIKAREAAAIEEYERRMERMEAWA